DNKKGKIGVVKMKEIFRYGLILGLICVVASGFLAGVNYLTKDRIIAQAKEEEDISLKEVMPQAEYFEPIKSQKEIIYYKAKDSNGNLLGVAFKASGKGYSSVIDTMVGMEKDGTITAIKVLSQNETPGLGANVEQKPFTAQFKYKKIQNLDVQVQAITGATISSKTVIDSVQKKAEEIKELIKDGK
ncbi:MAG: RnfABCDGE type electron transport complex subunit G, partial [Candidatus Omnitrophota bacterium]